MPKRGFSNEPHRKEHTTLNVSDFERFAAGAKIGPAELVASGLIHKVAKDGLRILGDGNLDRALHVTAHYFTASAKEKIVKAGGSAEVIVP
jgi:large subunit ribosomal protein L15